MMLDFILLVRFPAERAELEELVQGLLFMHAANGSTTETAADQIVVRAYFDDENARAAAKAALGEVAGLSIDESDNERLDWLENYQQSLYAFEVGEKFVVAPDPALIDDSSRIPIIIPQEQAFGTGSHETTALCLELLERAPVAGRRCADAGCGSGILAIAMAKLGASRVIAFDNDVDTFGVVPLNKHRNDVSRESIVQFFGSTEALRSGEFSVIVMNILPDVIVAIVDDAVRNLAAGGELIVSGVVLPSRDQVVAKCESLGLSLIEERTRGEWWAGRLRRS